LPCQLEINSKSLSYFSTFRSIDVIRGALAMGADSGIHVLTDMTID